MHARRLWLQALSLLVLVSCGGSSSLERSHARGMLPAHWTAADGQSQEVPFSFEATSSTQGRMFTTLGRGGEHFHGKYLRVEASTEGHLVTEVYDGWSGPEWGVWEHDAAGGWTETATSYGEFAHFYTGKLVATLSGSLTHAMRCRFSLKDPAGGLLHGGSGQCQVSDGGHLSLEF